MNSKISRPLLLDSLISFCQGISIILLPSVGLEIRGFFSPENVDWVWSLIFLPGVLSALVAMRAYPKFISAWGYHQVYQVGVFFNAIFFILLFAFVAIENISFWPILLLATVFQGIGFAWITASINVRVAVYFSENLHAGLSGVHSFFCLGAFFCPLYVEFVRRVYDWQFVCWPPAILLMSLVFLIQPVSNAPIYSKPVCKRKISYEEYTVYILIFLYGFAEATIGNWAAVFIGEVKQLQSETVAICLAIFWIFMAIGRMVGSVLARRVSRMLLHRSYIAIAFFGSILIITSSHRWETVFAYALTGLGCSVFFPFATSLAAMINKGMDDVVSAASISALLIGIGMSGPVAGILLNFGSVSVQALFLVAAILFLTLFISLTALSILRKDQLE